MNHENKSTQWAIDEQTEFQKCVAETKRPESGLIWTEDRIEYHAAFLNLIVKCQDIDYPSLTAKNAKTSITLVIRSVHSFLVQQ